MTKKCPFIIAKKIISKGLWFSFATVMVSVWTSALSKSSKYIDYPR